MPDPYDLIVIGSGPAGESAAAAASAFGKRAAIVERSPVVGGASANTGTLPSKTLRESALAISGLKARDLYGVRAADSGALAETALIAHTRSPTINGTTARRQ